MTTKPSPEEIATQAAGPMTDLLSQLEAATEGSRELDAEIFLATADPKLLVELGNPKAGEWNAIAPAPHYTTNLQDAVSLVPEGSYMKMTLARDHKTAWVWIERAEDEAIGHGPPALAVCQATIKASKAEAA